MIGFVVGSLLAVGLFKMMRYRRYARWAYANGHAPHGWHGRMGGWGEGRGFGFGRGRFVNLLDRLRLTPAQRDSVKEARGEVKAAFQSVRDTLSEVRHDVALALSAPAFEEELVGATSVKIDAAVDTLRKTLVSLVGRAHATLDEEQRLELARILSGTKADPRDAAFL